MKTFYAILLFPVWLLCACHSSELESLSVESGSTIGLNKGDSIAMVAIYNKIGPWGMEWDLHDVNTWGGVEAAWDEKNGEYRIVKFNYKGSFRGTIPEEFMQLTELRYLGLGGGTLSGSIPSWIGSLKKLEGLFLGHNYLEVTIPVEICNLPNLEDLIIVNTFMTGAIPKEIGKLKKLRRLNISGTDIGGEIPVELKDLPELEILDLKDNKFSGRFPVEIIGDYAIDCSFNCITELPLEVWKMDTAGFTIGFPDLQNNNLSGVLPEWVFETEQWKHYGCFVDRQNEGYGYENFKWR